MINDENKSLKHLTNFVNTCIYNGGLKLFLTLCLFIDIFTCPDISGGRYLVSYLHPGAFNYTHSINPFDIFLFTVNLIHCDAFTCICICYLIYIKLMYNSELDNL